MAEAQAEDPVVPKRKISESLEPENGDENGTAKRLKVGDLNGHGHGPDISGGDEGGRDDTVRQEEEPQSHEKPREERPGSSSSKGSRGNNAAVVRPPSPNEPQHASAPGSGRRDFRQEEKKRGRRLFGGLLSTLNQNKPSTHQVKRLEIERRQQERAQQQALEDDKRRVEKLVKLTAIRRIEQVKFEEQVMQTRHSNMLTAANSLQTKSEPKLYYRPWLLTERQEQTIKGQVREAEELIAKETQDFKQRKEEKLKELGAFDSQPESFDVGEPAPSKDANLHALESKVSHDKDPEETGDDEMEQDKEDAVLY